VYWWLRCMDGHPVLVPELDGRPVYTPRASECLDVAAALLLCGAIVAARGGMFAHSSMPPEWIQLGTFAVGAALVVRAIGDFHVVGFFKRVRDSRFAELDSHLFSPASLLLGLATLWVALG